MVTWVPCCSVAVLGCATWLTDCHKYFCYCLHSAVVPASGQVNSLMVVSFVIHNKSEMVQDFEIKMIQDDDTHFLAAGNQMVCFP